MILRPAQPSDRRSLAKLGRALSRHQSTCDPALRVRIPTAKEQERHFARSLRSRSSRILVAEKDGALVGFVHGSVEKPPHFNYPRLGYLHACYVDDAHRNGGVGRALVLALLDWFHARGLRVVDLGVLRSNVAFRFWKELGFREYYLKMRKRLS